MRFASTLSTGENKQLIIVCIIVLLFSLALIQAPLFNYLGYEFSAATALFLSLITGFTTTRIVKKSINATGENNVSLFIRGIAGSLKQQVVILFIPLLVATANMAFVKNCSYGEGMMFFIFIPVVTVIWSLTLGGLCAILFKRSFLIYLICIGAVLLYPLWVGYITPSIFSYNFLYGYFPGFSYDEVLIISPTLILSRAITMLSAAGIALLSVSIVSNINPAESAPRKIFNWYKTFRWNILHFLVFFSLLFFSFVLLYRNELGFEASSQFIRKTLSATYPTEHFTIVYQPGTFTIDELEFVAKEHEFRFFQVQKELNIKYTGIIRSYIYPDAETKRKFIGTGTTNIAKPWKKEIHLNKDSWQETLKHELVHVLAGQFGMRVIKAHYNTGLVEGLATAIDNDWGNRTLHEYAAAMEKFGIAPNPAKLISPGGFIAQSSGVSYVLMGSFCKYLIEKYGIDKFKTVYGGSSPETAFGKSYDILLTDWQTYLQTVNVPDSWETHIEYFFKRQSIFAKECARVIARVNEKGYQLLSLEDFDDAKTTFESSLAQSWNTPAFIGLVRTEYSTGSYDSVISFIRLQNNDSLHKSSVASLLLLYGNSLWAKGNINDAGAIFKQILDLDLSSQYNETAAMRLEIVNDQKLQMVLMPLLVNNSKQNRRFSTPVTDTSLISASLNPADLFSINLLDSLMQINQAPILPYLKAKILFRLKFYQQASELLAQAGSFQTHLLESAKNQLLCELFFKLKNFDKAIEYFTIAAHDITNEAYRAQIEDWIKRSEWFSKHTGNALEQ